MAVPIASADEEHYRWSYNESFAEKFSKVVVPIYKSGCSSLVCSSCSVFLSMHGIFSPYLSVCIFLTVSRFHIIKSRKKKSRRVEEERVL